VTVLAFAAALAATLHIWASSTCYSQGTVTASGEPVHVGIVAQNTLRFGTLIELDRPAFGRRYFRVEDRIGSGSELDIYNPSEAACIQYGRREVGYTVKP
jgi:3D (Asp-Asp-Asp) domain-containing protein